VSIVAREAGDSVSFAVKVVPRASRDEIAGFEGEAVKVRLKAPPVEGRANEALVAFLADLLEVSRARVEIVRGSTGRKKLLKIRGMTAAELMRRLKLE
jgi:uncharacterized protein (TIGR00251 family)